MNRIDSHQHFWKFDQHRDNWITDEMSVIRKDFLPEDLQPVLKRHGIDGCVAVQASQSEEETNFLISLAKEHGFIKGIVGWIDLQSARVKDRLEFYSTFHIVKGFRHVLQGEVQRDLMLTPAFKNGISALSRHGFTYDILIYPDQLKYSTELVTQFPEQKFVIDHIAKPSIKNKEIKTWEKDIREIASLENVYCKISGMVTEANWTTWKKEDFIPYMDVIVEAFDTNRILFGSDWPVCLVAASYERMMSIVNDYFSFFSNDEQKQFYGLNAKLFYNL